MTTHLRDNYYCNGFDTEKQKEKFIKQLFSLNSKFEIFHNGKTSEIPELLKCIESTLEYGKIRIFKGFNGKAYYTSKEAISSYLTKTDGSIYEYCLIYKV